MENVSLGRAFCRSSIGNPEATGRGYGEFGSRVMQAPH